MISKKDLYDFKDKSRVLLQTEDFVCILPLAPLRSYVSNYNITFPSNILLPDGLISVPSGCAALSIDVCEGGVVVNLDGPAARPFAFGGAFNKLKMVITIEFKPAGLYALLGAGQQEMVDKNFSFNEINPKLARMLADVAERSDNLCQLVESLDNLLLNNLYTPFNPHFEAALRGIVTCDGAISVKALAEEVHYSQRHLNRIFKDSIGMSIKAFSRLVRVNNAIRLLKKTNNITLISDAMGFYDLSHFMRDFKEVCGVTPQEYQKNMSNFYINPHRF
ncbi:MAG: helix-turn-helix transcriptional regulator [Defluviitaleaceae bacterium]|nr:helix-turn-helix transcriptional regulator [Defluviitaleaceae bacterium]